MKLSQIWLGMTSLLYIINGIYCFEEKLLYSTSSGKIKELNISNGEVRVLGNAESEVFVLAYDNEEKYVYVPRQTQGQIIRFPYPSNQTTEFEIVVSEIIPGGIAFDSEHRYLYWTEPMEGKIMRCNTDGSNITRIFNDTVEPAALTIDKGHRWMYFGQGIPNGTIHKLSLDGEGHHIINDLASWVFGIYADDTRLYWMDNFMGDLKSALFDGTDIQTIVSTNTFKLNGEIDVKEEFIFYTSSTQILKINTNGGEVPIVLHTDTERVHGLLLFKQEADIKYCVKDRNDIRTVITENLFRDETYGPKSRTPYDKSSFKVCTISYYGSNFLRQS